MSLINDALKRATSFKKRQTVDLGAPLQPVMPQGQSSARKVNIVPIAAVVLLVVVVGGGLWWWTGRTPTPTPVAAKKSGTTNKVSGAKDNTASDKADKSVAAVPAASTNNNPIARSMEVAKKVQGLNNEGADIAASLNNAKPEPTPGTQKNPAANPVVAKTAPATTAATPAATVAANKDFPAVKVQAIYFRQKGPSAVLNGKTVKQGDNIDGMRVASIDRNAVKLEFNGQMKSVSLR
jgi:cytoskeletal protein RodZ